MADDIFLSPEEQDERAKKWLKDNGPALAIGVALGLGGVYGYNEYQASQIEQAEIASAAYDKVLTTVNESAVSSIEETVAQLKSEHAGSAYAAKAALIRAKQLASSDLDAAYQELQWVVDNASESGIVHTARIRQAKIKIAQGDLEAAQVLASQSSFDGFESHYNELLADISRKNDKLEEARDYYQKAIDALDEGDFSYRQILTVKMDRLGVSDVASTDEAPATDK